MRSSHWRMSNLQVEEMLYGKTKKSGESLSGNSSSGSSNSRYYRLSFILWWVGLAGCTSLKKAALIGTGSIGAGAIASIATSGTAPVLLAAAGGASVTSVIADAMTPSTGGDMATAASCAPDNFWTLLGNLVSMGGWLLILVIVIPMILGWLLPGPLERAKKKKR